MFDVGRSMFDVHSFLLRFDRPFFGPAAGLTPDSPGPDLILHEFSEQKPDGTSDTEQ
jgi:hypothetical protein